MIETVFVVLILIASFFAYALIYTACGAFIGWVVGLTPLGGAVIHIWNTMTHMDVSCWELGAFLGFVSGFFHGLVKIEKEK